MKWSMMAFLIMTSAAAAQGPPPPSPQDYTRALTETVQQLTEQLIELRAQNAALMRQLALVHPVPPPSEESKPRP